MAILVPVVAGAALLALLFSGGGGKAAPHRPRYGGKIDVPGNGVPWTAIDEAICLCDEAGESDAVELVQCALQRVYPDVPWPAQPGDHVSVIRTWQAVGARVAAFVVDKANGEDPCAMVPAIDPVGPGGEEPPKPPGGNPFGPYVTGKPGGFASIVKGSNPTAWAAKIYNIPTNKPGDINRALGCAATVGFNLVFWSTPHNESEYGRGKYLNTYYDINRAWAPSNQSVLRAAAEGVKLHRQFGWNGGASVNGNGGGAYGTPWAPPVTKVGGIVSCNVGSGPWDPARNPPPEALALLGWTLAELQAVWEARYG